MIRIVSGRRDSGKSAYLRTFAQMTGAVGFLSEKVFGPGGLLGFDMVSLPSGDRRPLARLNADSFRLLISGGNGESRAGEPGTAPGPRLFRFRRFVFDRESFLWARGRALEILAGPDRPLVLDEIGPLEAEGRGLYPVLADFLRSRRELTVSCRPGLAPWVSERAAVETGTSVAVRVVSLLP